MEPVSWTAMAIAFLVIFVCMLAIYYLVFLCGRWEQRIEQEWRKVRTCNWVTFWKCVWQVVTTLVETLVWVWVTFEAFLMVIINIIGIIWAIGVAFA